MTSDRIKEVIRNKHFQPFRFHMGGGRSVDIVHPEFVALNPSGRIVVVFSPRDEMEIIDVLMIQSIEMLKASKRKGNGRRKAG